MSSQTSLKLPLSRFRADLLLLITAVIWGSAFVAQRVAPFKKLRALEVTDQIPKSPSGKILRRLLVQRERARASGA